MPQDFSEQINPKAIPAVLLPRPRLYAHFGKRLLDILLVVATAPITVPLVLLMALAVRLEGGPAFFRQDRIGRDARVFRLLKLRTMVPDA
ncbi:sugar transferase, partial [Tropicimonas sp.]|uniref:sugar transferase n=1 Tax=Tropicimonas sp. TaxID=2067044 RepID=UPI003A842F8A